MDSRLYELFLSCFPQFPVTEKTFEKLLDAENCDIITHCENGVTAGYSAVKDNYIRLLCVGPEYQGKGIGTELLRRSEEAVLSKGFDSVILGGTDSELFIGAVTPEEQWNDMRCFFFEDRGYTASDGCIEMKMSTKDFSENNTPEYPADVTFGYCPKEKRDELIKAVNEVDENWLMYFRPDSNIFTACQNGRIVGFCIADTNVETLISDDKKNIGMIGCVGVIPEARRKGIGLAMVSKAMSDIKSKGCDEVFIHYTHLDWWYGKLGFRTFLYYWFGRKSLK